MPNTAVKSDREVEMLQTLPRWRVTVSFDQVPDTKRAPIIFHLSDEHLQNVVRDVAALDFGLDVQGVEIRREASLQGIITGITNTTPQGQWTDEKLSEGWMK